MKKPTSIYRVFLRDAWRITWQRKSLWVFGLFASILYNGSVMDAVVNGARQLNSTSTLLTQLLDQSFIGYGFISAYLYQLSRINPTQFGIFLVLVTLLGLGLLAASVISQAALIHGASEHFVHARHSRRHVLPHFWSLLGLNLLLKVLMAVLFLSTLLPVWLFTLNNGAHPSLTTVGLFIFFAGIIFLHTLFMLSIIQVVHQNSTLINALHRAWSLFKKHWLAALELGLLLFIVTFTAGIILLALSTVLISLILLASSRVTQFLPVFLLTNLLALLITLGLTLAFAGISTTFHFAAWRAFSLHAEDRFLGRLPFAKLLRWFPILCPTRIKASKTS